MSMELTDIIHSSGAYKNFFFDACKQCKSIPLVRLQWIARNWYEVTKSFGLGLTQYTAVLARAVREASFLSRDALEQAFFEVTRISAHDLDLGLTKLGNPQGVDGIHYKLFANMVTPTILEKTELEAQKHPRLIDQARQIDKDFWRMFGSIAGGAAVLRVVEETAYNIVETMLPLFLAAEQDGQKTFAIENLTYITLHLKIEREHAQQSADIAELVLKADRYLLQDIIDGVNDLSQHFSDFWSIMHRRTFQ